MECKTKFNIASNVVGNEDGMNDSYHFSANSGYVKIF